jgi:predicted DNA-binding transcriptional regulator AlpA
MWSEAAIDKEELLEAVQRAIQETLGPVAEVQKIMSKPFITTVEVTKAYPIGKSTLDQMRMARRGPEFVQIDGGKVAYTHQALRDWFNRYRQKVL